MAIKYKAKYVLDGSVVVDESVLIELESGEVAEKATANGSCPRSNDAWERLVAESEERCNNVGQSDNSAPPVK